MMDGFPDFSGVLANVTVATEPQPEPIIRVTVEEGRAATAAAVAHFYRQFREYDARREQAEAAAKAELAKEAESEFGPEVGEWRRLLGEARAAAAEARRLAAVVPATNDSRWRGAAARDEAKAARGRASEASCAAEESKAGFRKAQADIRGKAKAAGRKAAGPHPVHGIRVDVGTGKSKANLDAIVPLVGDLRAAKDKRAIAVAIPAHTLGDQQAERLAKTANAAGISAGVWRSRKAPDPGHPDYLDASIAKENKTRMCHDIDAVMDAEEALADVQTAVCRNPKTGNQCAHFDECPFQRQKAAKHDVWFFAHELLFSGKPAEIGDVAAVVVDESAWQDSLFGVERQTLLLLSTLTDEDTTIPDEPLDTEQLRSTRGALAEALEAMEAPEDSAPRLPVLKAAVLGAGIDAAAAQSAYALEWKRKRDAEIHPGMPRSERKEAVKAVVHNKIIQSLGRVWKAVAHLVDDNGPDRSGWLSIGMSKREEGTAAAVYIKGRREVDESWHVPTLLMDATMQPDIVRLLWPTMELTADVRVQTPHQHIAQVVDRSYALSQLRRDSGFRDVHAILCRQARQYAPRTVLAVVQIEIEKRLLEVGNLPENLKLAHHNNIAGRDEWGDVASLVVVGRTEPSPRAAEWQAEAITGSAIDPLPGYYEKAMAWREMADGTFQPAEATRHPDPTAEAVRWHIAVGELVQIIGRPRGVNRTADNRVDVLILTDVPLPVPVERLISAENVEASPDDLMMSAGGFCLNGPVEAADAFQGLWGKKDKDGEKATATRKAAQAAFSAWQARGCYKIAFLASNANRVTYYDQTPEGEKCSNLRTVGFQAEGKGREPTLVCYDPEMVPDLEALLAERVGPLAWCVQKPQPKAKVAKEAQMRDAGLLPLNGRHAYHLYPGMFTSESAGSVHVARASIGALLEQPTSQSLRYSVTYKLASRGAGDCGARCTWWRFLELRREMKSALGPIAAFGVTVHPDLEYDTMPTGENRFLEYQQHFASRIAENDDDTPPSPEDAALTKAVRDFEDAVRTIVGQWRAAPHLRQPTTR
jgi:hypothetical protein